MFQLILYATTFFCNCWLAYKIAQPTDRQGLVLFIVLWLLLTALVRSTKAILPIIQQLFYLINRESQLTVQFKAESWHRLYNSLYSAAGFLLWILMQPGSIWQGFLYVLLWKLFATGILPWFVRTVPITNDTNNSHD
jgi:hypothetical protein